MKGTLKCFGCKEEFRREELTSFCGFGAKNAHNFCHKCLKERMERDRFATAICILFGLKAPGPRIWSERQRLREKYGYTDDVIIDCLNYLKEVEHTKFFSESLYMVQPQTVAKMEAHRIKEQELNQQLINAYNTIKENNNS